MYACLLKLPLKGRSREQLFLANFCLSQFSNIEQSWGNSHKPLLKSAIHYTSLSWKSLKWYFKNGDCKISFNILMIFNISFKDSVSDIRYIRFPLNYLIWCHGKTAVSETWVVYFFLLSNLRLFLNVFHLGRRTFLDKNTTLPNWARFGKKFWKLCPSFFLPGNYSLKYSIHVRAGRPEIICKGNFQNCQVKCTRVQEK